MTLVNENDWLLERLIASVNGTDREIEVTLLMEGLLISGKMVSGHRYLEEIQKKVIIDEPFGEGMNIANFELKTRLEVSAKHYIEQKDRRVANYVHLFDARFHKGSILKASGQRGVLWRGDLDKVSGFHLGS